MITVRVSRTVKVRAAIRAFTGNAARAFTARDERRVFRPA
jgi:hypothetical protein